MECLGSNHLVMIQETVVSTVSVYSILTYNCEKHVVQKEGNEYDKKDEFSRTTKVSNSVFDSHVCKITMQECHLLVHFTLSER